MQATTYILDSVKEQQRVTALENCFATWDDNIDIDVILQGLHDRFKAINQPLTGEICIERTSLNSIEIFTEDKSICKIINFPSDESTDVYWSTPSPLHPNEEGKMATWLLKNFHH